jgi:20S proteasome alpha/beta subunit
MPLSPQNRAIPLHCAVTHVRIMQGYNYDLTDDEAQELGRRSIIAAGHRDAFSGNTCNLYHVRQNGWEFIGETFLGTGIDHRADRL